MFDQKLPRRAVLKGALAGLVAIPVAGVATRAGAAAAATLDVNDPQAKALGYTPVSTKVDAKANPMYKPDQKCSNCLQYQGKPTDASAPCTIFAGKLVDAAGWCKVWAKKP
jgi:High potential iron-sulfur protein